MPLALSTPISLHYNNINDPNWPVSPPNCSLSPGGQHSHWETRHHGWTRLTIQRGESQKGAMRKEREEKERKMEGEQENWMRELGYFFK